MTTNFYVGNLVWITVQADFELWVVIAIDGEYLSLQSGEAIQWVHKSLVEA